MAYSSANLKNIGGGVVNDWVYDTADELPTVLGSGYITDAVTITKGAIGKGMVEGDRVRVRRFGTVGTPSTFVEDYECVVSAVNTTTGAGTLKTKGARVETVSATAGAATLAALAGVVTSEALTTAAAAEYTLTLTDSLIAAADVVLASAGLGTSTQGTPAIGGVTVSAGVAVITVTNVHASEAFNGTIKIAFAVIKA